jgi:nucleoside 2-deoxyribosyltransferase
MTTSDEVEVWSRGCLPRTNLVHLCMRDAACEWLEKEIRALGYEPTFSPVGRRHADARTAFEKELSSIESCGLLIVDLDAEPNLCVGRYFCVGYAVARGKSVIWLLTGATNDFHVTESVYLVKNMAELLRAMKAARE